jgi:hypothetical protein
MRDLDRCMGRVSRKIVGIEGEDTSYLMYLHPGDESGVMDLNS